MWNFRLAGPDDSESIAKWVAENPQIDPKDILNGMKKNQPTVLWFVAENNGVTVAAAPVFLSAVLAHLAFNPDARASEKMQAMDVLKDGVTAFMAQFGIRSISTQSNPGYPIAKWALAHDFEMDERNTFVLDLNKQMVEE